MSEFQTLGLSVHLFRPAIVLTVGSPNHCTTTLPGRVLGDVTERISDYSHSSSAFGGFDTASFSITSSRDEIESWFSSSLGAHVEVVDNAGDIVWEGFVDEVGIQYGALSLTRGPLTEVANQVYVVYQEEDTTTTPPTNAAPRVLYPALETAGSQQLYGIRSAFLTISSATASLATQIGTLWMAENAYPRTSEQVSLSGNRGGGPIVSFSCKGYFHAMTQSYYSATKGTVNASAKLASILDWENSSVNGLFSSSNASITTNTTQVPACEMEYVEMLAQIEEIVSAGDAAFDRYLFQVGPGRFVTYGPMPESYEYQQSLTWERQQVQTRQGEALMPWAIKAGKWLRFLDWLPAAEEQSSLRFDPRYMFIERVSYTAPFDVSFSGGKSDHIDQVMAQLGLAGETETT